LRCGATVRDRRFLGSLCGAGLRLRLMFAVVLLKVDCITKWEAVSSYPFLAAGAAFLIVVATSDMPSIVAKILTIAPLVALGRIS